jgi:hypothetical protein
MPKGWPSRQWLWHPVADDLEDRFRRRARQFAMAVAYARQQGPPLLECKVPPAVGDTITATSNTIVPRPTGPMPPPATLRCLHAAARAAEPAGKARLRRQGSDLIIITLGHHGRPLDRRSRAAGGAWLRHRPARPALAGAAARGRAVRCDPIRRWVRARGTWAVKTGGFGAEIVAKLHEALAGEMRLSIRPDNLARHAHTGSSVAPEGADSRHRHHPRRGRRPSRHLRFRANGHDRIIVDHRVCTLRPGSVPSFLDLSRIGTPHYAAIVAVGRAAICTQCSPNALGPC